MLLLLRFRLHNDTDLFFELREFLFCYVPNDLIIDTEIEMYELVSETSQGLPGYFRVICLEICRYVFGSLSDHLEIANNSILGLPVLKELLIGQSFCVK